MKEHEMNMKEHEMNMKEHEMNMKWTWNEHEMNMKEHEMNMNTDMPTYLCFSLFGEIDWLDWLSPDLSRSVDLLCLAVCISILQYISILVY